MSCLVAGIDNTSSRKLRVNAGYGRDLLLIALLAIVAVLPELSNSSSFAQRTGIKVDSTQLQHALSLIDSGKAQEAEPLLRKLLAQHPADDRVNEALGLIYAEDGQLAKALPLLQRACREAPHSALNHANLGAAWLKLDRYHEAVKELTTAAAFDPQNGATLSSLGQAYMLIASPKNAADAFSKAANIDPHNADLLYNWAVALNQTGETSRAAEVLRRIPAEEMSDEAESLAGSIDEKLGNSVSAVNHYQRAAQINPSEGNIYALCIELIRHWAWDSAQKTAEYGISKYASSVRMKMVLAVALYGNKKNADAAAVFADLLNKDPGNSMYSEMLARICAQISGEASGCNVLKTFSSEHPENVPAAVYAVQQILQGPHSKQDLDKANQVLTKAVALNPKLPEAWYELGTVEDERGNWEESARLLQKAIALQPDYAVAHYRLANVYAHLGRQEDRKKELALFQQYGEQEKEQLDDKIKAITIFLTNNNQ